jgi:hypothetical protein
VRLEPDDIPSLSHHDANTDHVIENVPRSSLELCLSLHASFIHEARQRVIPPYVGTMARSVRLFLVRHGETVDNFAQL